MSELAYTPLEYRERQRTALEAWRDHYWRLGESVLLGRTTPTALTPDFASCVAILDGLVALRHMPERLKPTVAPC